MDGNKLNLTRKISEKEPLASYREIPEIEMEEEAITRPKAKITVIPKNKSSEADGAHEKMLQEDGKNNINDKGDASVKEKNGDAKLDIGELKSDLLYLDKEELMKTANDPFWIKIRWFFFILFWLSWFGMLAGAIFIIYSAPKCGVEVPRSKLEWWEEGPLVEIQPDTKLEDLKMHKDNHVKGLIIDWPEDTYASLDDNHRIVQLLNKSKEIKIPIIIGLTAGISSKWFDDSEKQTNFDNYYVWKMSRGRNESGVPIPPNNWISRNNKSSWLYSTIRKEFYFAPEAWPQLNFRNEKIIAEFNKAMRSFAEKGAKGFRINDAATLLVDSDFDDQPASQSFDAIKYVHTEYGFYVHSKTEDLPELGPLLKQFRLVAKNCTENGPFMIGNKIKKIESYKVQNKLVIDLPVATLFQASEFNTEHVIKVFDYVFKVQGFSWPLWKNTKIPSFSEDTLYGFISLLPGVPLHDVHKMVDWNIWKMRKEPAVIRGSFNYKTLVNNTALAYTRSTSGSSISLLVAINPSNETIIVNFDKEFNDIPPEILVFNRNSSSISSNFSLEPKSSIVEIGRAHV